MAVDLSIGTPVLIATLEDVATVVDAIGTASLIAVDLEGMNDTPGVEPSPEKRCALLTIALSTEKIFIIDLFAIGEDAWTQSGASHPDTNLKLILESADVEKLMWDCRYDNHTLVLGHGVRLANVVDLQVGSALAASSNPWLYGLNGKTLLAQLRSFGYGATAFAARFNTVSDVGKSVWCERFGGDMATWRRRPLEPSLLAYSGQDAGALFLLNDARLGMSSRERRARAETEERLRVGLRVGYDPAGSHNRKNPFNTGGATHRRRW